MKRVTHAVLVLLTSSTFAGAQVPSGPAVPRDTSPHAVRFVTVAPDVRLEVLDWGGTGRPVVLLAGVGNNAHVYDQFAPKLVDRSHVCAITRRGFVLSSIPQDGYLADSLADDVLAVLDTPGAAARPSTVGGRAGRGAQRYRATEGAASTAGAPGHLRRQIAAFRRGVPQARVVILPHADHYIWRSNEADVLRALRSFADGLPGIR